MPSPPLAKAVLSRTAAVAPRTAMPAAKLRSLRHASSSADASTAKPSPLSRARHSRAAAPDAAMRIPAPMLARASSPRAVSGASTLMPTVPPLAVRSAATAPGWANANARPRPPRFDHGAIGDRRRRSRPRGRRARFRDRCAGRTAITTRPSPLRSLADATASPMVGKSPSPVERYPGVHAAGVSSAAPPPAAAGRERRSRARSALPCPPRAR